MNPSADVEDSGRGGVPGRIVTPRQPPPQPTRRPKVLTRADGTSLVDDWHWLRDKDDPEVISHLEAENAWTARCLAPLRDLQATIFEEIRTRVQESDASAPVLSPRRDDLADPDGPFVYYQRTLAGQQYAVRARRPAPAGVRDVDDLPDHLRLAVDPHDPPADEQILLDENVEAAASEYFRLGAFAVSPCQRMSAEAVDLSGGELYAIRFRDLATGALLDDVIERAATSVAWHDDSSTILYTVPDAAWRPHQVWRHRLGTPAADDELLLTEPDERFWLGLGRLRSQRYLAITASSKVTSHWWLVDARDASAAPRTVVERSPGVEVSLDHRGDLLYLVTNADGAADFKLCTVPVDRPDAPPVELVGHRPGIRLESVDAFEGHLVLSERAEARTRLRICDPHTGEGEIVEVPEALAVTGLGPNPIFTTGTVRLVTTSMVRPTEVIDVAVQTGHRRVIKRQEVPGGHDPADYVTWREWADAPDGTPVPMTLVARADRHDDAPAPCVLYGYGAYEISIDPTFSVSRLSLLDRGVVFAIAHVRGGGEMGRRWYEQGRLEHKANTFTDFIACARHLIDQGVTSADRLAIRGGSAGGMLIGVAVNLRGDLFAAAVAEVPFVDVVTTMLDTSIPLTVIEYDEWGDPGQPETCQIMRSYSPYDNVTAGPRPAMLVTAGLNDPRVQYWEPAKWVAKLRATAEGGGPVLLKTEMGAGHGGRSGRYDAWRDEAEALAFILSAVGAAEPRAP